MCYSHRASAHEGRREAASVVTWASFKHTECTFSTKTHTLWRDVSDRHLILSPYVSLHLCVLQWKMRLLGVFISCPHCPPPSSGRLRVVNWLNRFALTPLCIVNLYSPHSPGRLFATGNCAAGVEHLWLTTVCTFCSTSGIIGSCWPSHAAFWMDTEH